MFVRPVTHAEELPALAESWNGLAAGTPFRRFEWLHAWWRHFGDRARREAELLVLAVHETPDAPMVGLAPWFIAPSRGRGRVVRFLGSGEVCSDHVSVLAVPGTEVKVAAALANWLSGPAAETWDALELEAVSAKDVVVPRLVEHLQLQGNATHEQPGQACWRLPLPATWDQYLALLSKSHRKQVRRAIRDYFDTGLAKLRTAHSADELAEAYARFVELHQRRRTSLGQRGCFGSRRFAAFLDEATEQMFSTGRIRLSQLEFDGQVIAADYLLVEGRSLFAYQGGFEPERTHLGPGHLLAIAEIRQAIEQGYESLDFLRGNEPFKAHLRAVAQPTIDYRVAADSIAARLRHRVWLSQQRARSWARRGLLLAGEWSGAARTYQGTPR